MKTQIKTRKVPMPAAMLRKVETHLGIALGRFGGRVARVVLKVSNTGPGDGPRQKHCQVVVFLRPRMILVEGKSLDLLAAVERAARRASRSVALELDRENART